MTGADIVGNLLRADPELVALVPIERQKLAVLPDSIPLPAIVLRLVSSVDRQTLVAGETVRVTDRIGVTVRAASYRDQRAVLAMVKRICRARTGDIGGGTGVSILTAGTGPDVGGPANSFEQTQDFRVSYEEATRGA